VPHLLKSARDIFCCFFLRSALDSTTLAASPRDGKAASGSAAKAAGSGARLALPDSSSSSTWVAHALLGGMLGNVRGVAGCSESVQSMSMQIVTVEALGVAGSLFPTLYGGRIGRCAGSVHGQHGTLGWCLRHADDPLDTA
jgi:hypothetical protein